MDGYGLNWRKASYSGSGGGNCVEVGNAGHAVLVRDSTNRDGATLSIPASAWESFTSTLR
jgi:hypothetical protein